MNFQYGFSADSEEGFAAMVVYYLISALFGGGMGVVLYILRGLGLHAIAKRRGLKHAWFAWLPVVRNYQLGCISDQYQYVVKGRNTSRRKWLLGLGILSVILSAVTLGSAVGMIARIAGFAMRGASQPKLINAAMSALMKLLLLGLPLLLISVPAAVIRYVALYDLYTSCEPKNKVLYLLLSILFHKTEAFFLFFTRHKDEGMPPRKAKPDPEPVREQPPVTEDTEPWKRPESDEE